MFGMNKSFAVTIAVSTLVTLTGCAGLDTSKHVYTPSAKVNEVVKSSDCYDASLLLAKDLIASKEIAKKVLVGVDSTIATESGNTLKADRNRHVGVFVGSGGEELFVNLKDVSKENTFITITTKTGFVGGAGQKAWSCQIADEMVKMATK